MAREKKIVWSLDAQTQKLNAKLESLEGRFNKTGGKGFDAFKLKIAAAITTATIALTQFISKINTSVRAASDLEEANNKLFTVFSNLKTEAAEVRDLLVNTYKQSTLQATNLLSATGDILTGFGIEQKLALELSKQVNVLAADIASFSNAQGGAEAVSAALTKALIGERESLKTYGVAILDADVKQRLLEKGQSKLIGTAERQAKAIATVELAYEQSKNAIGDLIRTSDSYANIERRLTANQENFNVALGQRFLPYAREAKLVFNELLETATDFIKIPLSEKTREEQVELNGLVSAISLTNQGQNIRNGLIAELQKKYPFFLSNIKTEEINNKDLKDRLEEVNRAFKAKILLQIAESEVQEELRSLYDANKKQLDALKKATTEFYEETGTNIDTTENLNEALDIMYAYVRQNKLEFSELAVALQDYDDATKSITRSEKEQTENQIERNKILEKYGALIEKVFKEPTVKEIKTTFSPGTTEKEIEKSKKLFESYQQFLNNEVEKFKQLKDKQANDDIRTEETKIDLLYKLGKLSNEQYQQILNDRLEFAKEFYGEDTEEYLRAVEDKNRLEEESTERTRNVLRSLFDTSIQDFDNFGERLKQKMLQLLLDNVFQLFLNFFSFGLSNSPVLTSGSLFKGTFLDGFASGVSNYSGGIAKVHKDELVTNLPKGSNVFTKTETSNLLDIKPLISEIRALRKDVRVLHNGYEVIRGETVYRLYKKQDNKRLSTN